MFPRDFLQDKKDSEEIEAIHLDVLVLPLLALLTGLVTASIIFLLEILAKNKKKKQNKITQKEDHDIAVVAHNYMQ